VVDAANGAGLAGVAIAMRSLPIPELGDPPLDWTEPTPVASTEDGTFELRFVPAATLSAEIAFKAPQRVKTHRWFGALRRGAEVDFGDVPMTAGTLVQVRVAVEGRPLRDVKIGQSEDVNGAPIENWHTTFEMTDASGQLSIGVLPPGCTWFQVAGPYLDNQRRFEIPLQSEPFLAELALREPPREQCVSGSLLTTTGTPVSGVQLGIAATGTGSFVASTDAEGRFRFWWPRPPKFPDDPAITLFGPHPELELLDAGGVPRLGSEHRLLVRRRSPGTLTLTVVERSTGEPIERFGASCWRSCWQVPRSDGPDFRRANSAEHAGGVARFEGLAAGVHYLSVFPPAPWAERAEIEVTIAEGQHVARRIEVDPPAALAVTVIDADNREPVPEVEVMLAKVVPLAGLAAIKPEDWRARVELLRRGHSYSSGTNIMVLASGRSGADGIATLMAPPEIDGLVLIAEGDACMAAMRKDVALPRGGAATTIAVPRAASLAGVVTPIVFVERFGPAPELLAQDAELAKREWVDPKRREDDYPVVELRSADARMTLRGRAYLDANGGFRLGSLPNGRYHVFLSGSGSGGQWQIGPLATVAVDARMCPSKSPYGCCSTASRAAERCACRQSNLGSVAASSKSMRTVAAAHRG
jgi:hypothetical protein